MEVDTFNLVIVNVSDRYVSVAELPSISALVLLRAYDLRYYVLLELDNCRLMNDHEVDVLSSGCLSISASFLLGSCAVKLIDSSVETSLRYFDNASELVKYCLALSCIEISYEAEKSRSDEEVSLRLRNLVVIHTVSCCSDSCDYSGASCEVSCCSCADSRSACIASKTESINLRNYLSTDELASETSESYACGLDVVHAVDGEHTTTVEVTSDCLVCESNVAVNVSGALRIISETVHTHLRDDELVCVCALLYELRSSIEYSCKRCSLVYFVKDASDLLLK